MNGHFDIGAITPTKYFFSIAIVLGLLFAMISVDQDKAPLLVFLQWQLQTLLPMALLVGAHMLFLKSHRFADLNPWLAISVSGLIGASLFAPIALAIDFWLEPQAQVASYSAELFDEWISVTPPVTICWVALNVPWLLGYRFDKASSADGPIEVIDNPPVQEPDFILLLPPEKRGRLLYLKSELHYLQVVTDQGSSLILYNLGDAIAQLPATIGLSVHRSYWVALEAIEALTRQGRQGVLKLSNGQTVPVSRNQLNAVSTRLETP